MLEETPAPGVIMGNMGMAERNLELRAARARRQYWQEQVDAAKRGGDRDAETRARQFVSEYDQLITEIEQAGGGQPLAQ